MICSSATAIRARRGDGDGVHGQLLPHHRRTTTSCSPITSGRCPATRCTRAPRGVQGGRTRSGGAQLLRRADWGTPAQILEKLRWRRELLGDFELNLISHYGGMSVDDAERSMRLFAETVLPEIRRWWDAARARPPHPSVRNGRRARVRAMRPARSARHGRPRARAARTRARCARLGARRRLLRVRRGRSGPPRARCDARRRSDPRAAPQRPAVDAELARDRAARPRSRRAHAERRRARRGRARDRSRLSLRRLAARAPRRGRAAESRRRFAPPARTRRHGRHRRDADEWARRGRRVRRGARARRAVAARDRDGNARALGRRSRRPASRSAR